MKPTGEVSSMAAERFAITSAVLKAFLIASSSKIDLTAGFYQTSREKDLALFSRLARVAEQCQAARDLAGLSTLSSVLRGLGWEPAVSVGNYYRALVVKRFNYGGVGVGDIAESERILAEECPSLPPNYRSRALMAHANSAGLMGHKDEAARLFLESWKAGQCNNFCDPKTVLSAARFLAFWLASDGSPQRAIDNLDGMMSMVITASRTYPFLYYNHLDTTAFVLGIAGRWRAAEKISRTVMAAPMLGAYPEWTANYAEISRKAFTRGAASVRRHAHGGSAVQATVTSIADWKAKKEKKSVTAAQSIGDKKARFLGILAKRGLSSTELSRLLDDVPWEARHDALISWVVTCADEVLLDSVLGSLLRIAGN